MITVSTVRRQESDQKCYLDTNAVGIVHAGVVQKNHHENTNGTHSLRLDPSLAQALFDTRIPHLEDEAAAKASILRRFSLDRRSGGLRSIHSGGRDDSQMVSEALASSSRGRRTLPHLLLDPVAPSAAPSPSDRLPGQPLASAAIRSRQRMIISNSSNPHASRIFSLRPPAISRPAMLIT